MGVGCILEQFVVSCVLFVMMSTNTAKNPAVSEDRLVLTGLIWFLSRRKLGQYADQELLKSLFQNKTPDLIKLKISLLQVHDQRGKQ